MPEEKSGFFAIDIGMWSSPGWQFVREQAEKQEREKAQKALDAFIQAAEDLETYVSFGPFYIPGIGLRLPESYKRRRRDAN